MKPKKNKSRKKHGKKSRKRDKKTLDAVSGSKPNRRKSNLGRKRKLPWSTVTGRAANFEFQLEEVWHRLGVPLLAATTEEKVTEVFDEFGQPYARDFVPRLSSDILLLLKDKDFPQRPIPRIKFLARSLAGRSTLSFRSSRDICEKEALRERRKSPHRILRREYFIECSCGYKGPALNNDCPGCGAQPQLSIYDWTGRAPELPEVPPKKKKVFKMAEPEIQEAAPDPRTVRCECGTTISAASREATLEVLAKHKREEHGEVVDKQFDQSQE